MDTSTILSVMLALAPYHRAAALEPVARAIAGVTTDPREQAQLVSVSFLENTFTRGIPFGVTAVSRRALPVDKAAGVSLAILRRSARVCGPRAAVRMGWYQSGRCVANAYGERSARLARRVLARVSRGGGPR
jgi:hypothetical protein